MKILILSALALLLLSPLATSSYASCRDNSGPKGSFETCSRLP